MSMVPPIEVDTDRIANGKYHKLKEQIHRARTWQTVQRAIDAINCDLMMSPAMVEELLEYAQKRIVVVSEAMVVVKRRVRTEG
jgi:hypothetical protein